MRKRIDILENLLRVWEETGFIRSCLKKAADMCGNPPGYPPIFDEAYPEILLHWRDLREHLLQAQTGGAFDSARFLGAPNIEALNDNGDRLNYFRLLPWALWQWSAHSRRVFRIDDDLQALLRVTSFHKELTGGDLKLPFPAFLLLPARPIAYAPAAGLRPRSYAGLLAFIVPPAITGRQGTELLGIFLLPSSLEDFKGSTSLDRDSVRKALHRGDGEKAGRRLGSLQAALDDLVRDEDGDACVGFAFVRLEKLKSLIEGEREHACGPLVLEAFRLVIGFSLYLQTLPSGGSHRSDWQRPPRLAKPDPRSITNEAEICTVSSVYALTSAERDRYFSVSVATGREVCAHTRRGHFRRRPGEGTNPLASKVIWVRPAIVRQDRLGPGELVGGTDSAL